MAETWLVLSLITLVVWGFFGFLSKIVLNHLDWKQVYVISGLSSAVLIVAVSLFLRPAIDFRNTGTMVAMLAGVTVIGSLSFFIALSQGKASIIIPMTALYPVVGVALGFLILHEKINLFQGLGIILAIASVFLLSLG